MLRERGGFCDQKKDILKGYLKSHLKGGDIHSYGKGEAGLARMIAADKRLYIRVGKWYKLLDERTIIAYLRNMKHEVEEEIAEESEERKEARKKHNSH